MANIKLNFLPIDNNSFEFTVFRKLTSELDEKIEKSEMRYSFLEDEFSEERKPYIVSFVPKEGFTSYQINSLDSLGLTKKYLLIKLIETLITPPARSHTSI